MRGLSRRYKLLPGRHVRQHSKQLWVQLRQLPDYLQYTVRIVQNHSLPATVATAATVATLGTSIATVATLATRRRVRSRRKRDSNS